jgi:hypothetical protein
MKHNTFIIFFPSHKKAIESPPPLTSTTTPHYPRRRLKSNKRNSDKRRKCLSVVVLFFATRTLCAYANALRKHKFTCFISDSGIHAWGREGAEIKIKTKDFFFSALNSKFLSQTQYRYTARVSRPNIRCVCCEQTVR